MLSEEAVTLTPALLGFVGRPLRHRDEFTVAFADCPNACSRPQIADLGLIGAAEPGTTAEPTTADGDRPDREGGPQTK